MPQDHEQPSPSPRNTNPARPPQPPAKGLLQRILERLGLRRRKRLKKSSDPNIYPLY